MTSAVQQRNVARMADSRFTPGWVTVGPRDIEITGWKATDANPAELTAHAKEWAIERLNEIVVTYAPPGDPDVADSAPAVKFPEIGDTAKEAKARMEDHLARCGLCREIETKALLPDRCPGCGIFRGAATDEAWVRQIESCAGPIAEPNVEPVSDKVADRIAAALTDGAWVCDRCGRTAGGPEDAVPWGWRQLVGRGAAFDFCAPCGVEFDGFLIEPTRTRRESIASVVAALERADAQVRAELDRG